MIIDDNEDPEPETNVVPKVDTQEGGLIKIRNEESISAFNIDINNLKTKILQNKPRKKPQKSL